MVADNLGRRMAAVLDGFPDDGEAVFSAPSVEDGAALLDAVEAFLARFVAYPSVHALVAHTIWIAHTHLMDVWESTPRIAFLSPEPASGKTRALEVSELLVPNPVEAVNVTPAYLFRKVGDETTRPTILFDEIDAVFGPKAKENEELRGLLNAGHRRGAVAGRCVVRGKVIDTEEIPAYCAVALAGLGELPETILTRSVIVRMRRRAVHEHLEPFRRRKEAEAGDILRARLAQWTARIAKDVIDVWPELPDVITDRDADVWEPLLAVADAAGGDWRRRAREAAVALVAASKESTPSPGIRLLNDLRTMFNVRYVMSTEAILTALREMDEAPWASLKGEPIDARGLARLLGNYGVKSEVFGIGDKTPRGYDAADLSDAWVRYLTPEKPDDADVTAPSRPSSGGSATSATCAGRPEQRGDPGAGVVRPSSTSTQPSPLYLSDAAQLAPVAVIAEHDDSLLFGGYCELCGDPTGGSPLCWSCR